MTDEHGTVGSRVDVCPRRLSNGIPLRCVGLLRYEHEIQWRSARTTAIVKVGILISRVEARMRLVIRDFDLDRRLRSRCELS